MTSGVALLGPSFAAGSPDTFVNPGTYDLQTVIVKKSFDGQDRTREDAAEIADRHAKRALYTSRETSTSFRFRQRPPTDFIKSSFRTKNIGDGVSLVFGRLKRGMKPLGKRRRRNPGHSDDGIHPQDVIHFQGCLPDPGPCAWLGAATEVCWVKVLGRKSYERETWDNPDGWMMLWSPKLSAVICVPQGEMEPSDEEDGDVSSIVKRWNKRSPSASGYMDIPKCSLEELGKAKHIVYRSDKWNPGAFHDYIHDFQEGVRCFTDNPKSPRMFVICGGRLTVTERGLIY